MIVSDTMTITSRVTAIDDVRVWIDGHIVPAGASGDAVWAIQMALTEALANVIAHGYGGDESQTIHLALEVHEDRVEIAIVDAAEPFDEATFKTPDPSEPRAGGYGLQLIGELMDEVERTVTPDGGTRLRLVKRRWKEGT